LNVKEIATRLGYQDQFHFSRQFKAFQGASPSEYRDHGGSSVAKA
jgi:AraC-like DNA-binding protein